MNNGVEASGMDDVLADFMAEINALPEAESTAVEAEANPDSEPEAPEVESAKLDAPTIGPVLPSSKPPEPAKLPAHKSMYNNFTKASVQVGNREFDTMDSFKASEAAEMETDDVSTNEKEISLPTEPVCVWQQCVDEQSQYPYYWNYQNNKVTWEIPAAYTKYLLELQIYQRQLDTLRKKGVDVDKLLEERTKTQTDTPTSKDDAPTPTKQTDIGEIERMSTEVADVTSGRGDEEAERVPPDMIDKSPVRSDESEDEDLSKYNLLSDDEQTKETEEKKSSRATSRSSSRSSRNSSRSRSPASVSGGSPSPTRSRSASRSPQPGHSSPSPPRGRQSRSRSSETRSSSGSSRSSSSSSVAEAPRSGLSLVLGTYGSGSESDAEEAAKSPEKSERKSPARNKPQGKRKASISSSSSSSEDESRAEPTKLSFDPDDIERELQATLNSMNKAKKLEEKKKRLEELETSDPVLDKEAEELSSVLQDKLDFFSVTPLSVLQTLQCQLQTRTEDLAAGVLSVRYYIRCVRSALDQLSQHEQRVVPPGWSAVWCSEYKRYYFLDEITGDSQWEFPDTAEDQMKPNKPVISQELLKMAPPPPPGAVPPNASRPRAKRSKPTLPNKPPTKSDKPPRKVKRFERDSFLETMQVLQKKQAEDTIHKTKLLIEKKSLVNKAFQDIFAPIQDEDPAETERPAPTAAPLTLGKQRTFIQPEVSIRKKSELLMETSQQPEDTGSRDDESPEPETTTVSAAPAMTQFVPAQMLMPQAALPGVTVVSPTIPQVYPGLNPLSTLATTPLNPLSTLATTPLVSAALPSPHLMGPAAQLSAPAQITIPAAQLTVPASQLPTAQMTAGLAHVAPMAPLIPGVLPAVPLAAPTPTADSSGASASLPEETNGTEPDPDEYNPEQPSEDIDDMELEAPHERYTPHVVASAAIIAKPASIHRPEVAMEPAPAAVEAVPEPVESTVTEAEAQPTPTSTAAPAPPAAPASGKKKKKLKTGKNLGSKKKNMSGLVSQWQQRQNEMEEDIQRMNKL